MDTTKPTNQIVIDVYDGFFTVKTTSDMTVAEMYTILVGCITAVTQSRGLTEYSLAALVACIQHLEDSVDGAIDNSSSHMLN
jgi:hypothetical protein